MQLRLAAFNLENLFNRYLFLDEPGAAYETQLLPAGVAGIDRFGHVQAGATTTLQRNNTARAILEVQPDVLAVEEVEDLKALRSFNSDYLDGYFDRILLIEGNDGRGIDVGLCIRQGCEAKVVGLRTHIDELTPEARGKGWRIDRFFDAGRNAPMVKNALFSRDCLEVDLDAGGASLTLLVNHFKSQRDGGDALRRAQAARVAELVGEARERGRAPVVMGDLNEDWDRKAQSNLQPLKQLVTDGVLADPFADVEDRWTHFFAVGHDVSRLDYLLVDASLQVCGRSILRKGLSLKCTAPGVGERYPSIGYVDTEASDHCPISVTLDLG